MQFSSKTALSCYVTVFPSFTPPVANAGRRDGAAAGGSEARAYRPAGWIRLRRRLALRRRQQDGGGCVVSEGCNPVTWELSELVLVVFRAKAPRVTLLLRLHRRAVVHCALGWRVPGNDSQTMRRSTTTVCARLLRAQRLERLYELLMCCQVFVCAGIAVI